MTDHVEESSCLHLWVYTAVSVEREGATVVSAVCSRCDAESPDPLALTSSRPEGGGRTDPHLEVG